MKLDLRRATLLAVLALALTLVVPTGAVLDASSDRVFPESGLVLQPADGPNGAYASVGSDGNLSIDLDGPGLNADARSVLDDVFAVSNHGDEPMRVWLTHDATDRVSFTVGSGVRLDDPASDVVLSPGERRAVSVEVRTEGALAGTEVLRNVTVHSESMATTTTTTTTGGPSGGSSGGSGSTTTTTTTTTTTAPGTTTTTPGLNETVEVEFGDDSSTTVDSGTGDATSDDGVTVTELNVGDIDGDADTAGPRAVIVSGDDASTGGNDSGDVDLGRNGTGGDGFSALDARAISTVGETVTLSGSRSLVGSLEAVDSQRRIVKAVDIGVPADRSDRPGTVRIRVARSKFGDSDPTASRIGHLEDGGWQLLSTRIVEETPEYVTFEADTPSFSPFAVFAETEVQFEWTSETGTFEGEEGEFSFSTPGLRTVRLTVTDAFGRWDRAEFQILVNDVPEAAIRLPANVTAGEPTLLRADVEDEVGNATATWTLPDGTTRTGPVVEYAFGPGEHAISLTVEDEYGASTTVERTVVVGSGGTVIGPTVRDVPLLLVVGLAALLFALGWVVRPHWPAAVARWLGARWLVVARRHAPAVTTFETPRLDPTERRFEIPALVVEDPGGDLETVSVTVLDEGGLEVGTETVRIDGAASYSASPERVEPASRVYASDDRSYAVVVEATDAGGHTTEVRRDLDPAAVPTARGRPRRSGPHSPGAPAGGRP